MKNIAKKSNTIEILNKYHLTAAKKYGQNFLTDPNVIERIVDAAGISDATCVIEIGPGIGSLTEVLAKRAKRVICYEIDERFKPILADTLKEFTNVTIHFEDFMKVDLAAAMAAVSEPDICVVTNLPYYLTSDIIKKIVTSQTRIRRMIAMVQKEVALKLTGKEKSPLRFMIDYVGDIHYLMSVSKKVFIPAPHVDSAVFRIDKNRLIDASLVELIEGGFKQKRKTILNNMKPFFDDPRAVLEKCHIDPSARAQQLSAEDFVRLNQERRKL